MANQPTYIAYQVREGESEEDESKDYWTRIGAAWEHKDGKGFGLKLDLFPRDGRIVLRERGEKRPSKE